ncbi:MAG: hypothetical protein IKT58_07260 [Oscillospiraceae bacterium]|nr:hypothetical protein [Oscillospiraceae bacterium]
MTERPQLIIMLTHHDKTVVNAREIFEECKDTKAQYWGLKEIGLSQEEIKGLFSYMKACGKTTVLEVVAYTEETSLEGAKLAVDCGCDILMGTMYFDSVNDICKDHGLKYMPFVGQIHSRPSVLEGEVEDMLAQAKDCLEKGVYGFDLLSYRYTGDPLELSRRFVSSVPAPVCIAGSIHSLQRLEEVKALSPWAFTIGGAFFESCFGQGFKEQINRVYEIICGKNR